MLPIATLPSYARSILPFGIAGRLPWLIRDIGAHAETGVRYLSNYTFPPTHHFSNQVKKDAGSTSNSPLIPNLPILEMVGELDIAKQVAKMAEIESPWLAFNLHGFKTNGTILKFFIDTLKFKKERIFVADKFYSTSPQWELMMRELGVNYYKIPTPTVLGGYNAVYTHTLKSMWDALNQQIARDNLPASRIKVLVVSDGGHLPKLTPSDTRLMQIAGVEQTTSGLKKIDNVLYPIVEVASCAGKTKLESLLIAEDLFLHVHPYLSNEPAPANKVCGIVGNGTIGTALAKYLLKLGFSVWVYDKHPNAFGKIRDNVIVCNNVQALLENCDYVFGCTGENVFPHNNIDPKKFLLNREKNITFFSCSSSNVEWEDLIYTVRDNTETGKGRLAIPPMSDINYITPQNATVMIANMGYPINFNRQEETIPEDSIAYTRSLMVIGAMQAYLKARTPFADGHTINCAERIPLDASLQKKVTHFWLDRQPPQRFPKEIVENFKDEIWIAQNSQSKHEQQHYSPLPLSKKGSRL